MTAKRGLARPPDVHVAVKRTAVVPEAFCARPPRVSHYPEAAA
jgi:hypothetical protein